MIRALGCKLRINRSAIATLGRLTVPPMSRLVLVSSMTSGSALT
jgi:hypothetical protein